jgi:hypothetical protein
MKRILLPATMILGCASLGSMASAATYDWTLSGADNGSGQLTVGNAMTVTYTVTGGTDPGTVSTTGYDILSFTGVIDGHSVTLLGGQPGFLPNPPDPGTPPGVSGSPAFSAYGLSYDNILYVNGTSVLIPCELTPALTNQYLDAYGVLLSYKGIEGEIWGNGPFGPPGNYYTFATQNSTSGAGGGYLYSNSVERFSITTPEPSTWAMMLVGFVGLVFAGYLPSRKRISVAG